ncbi:MAG: helix-turn-helix domain-containing protein [Flavobacteriaceae bacterium]|nr:helix-turn-helix domain-containing protein [Flavobacteriaceae bacterium]
MQTNNPFREILDELHEVKEILHSIQNEPELELQRKFYSIQEAAEILKLNYQTVRNHILNGNLKAERIGRPYRINHYDLMEALKNVKSLKYKRKA